MSRPCHAAVIIPTFNNARELSRAVGSVVASAEDARKNYHLDLTLNLVLSDDGSTDGTPRFAADLAAQPTPPWLSIIPVRSLENRGAGPARNAGVAATTAKFLLFLDADDEFLPPHIGLCLGTLLTDPAIGYVWGRRSWDVPVHASWQDGLDKSSVMNLCLRRPWHDLCGGFPEHPDFRTHGYEDCVYRVILRQVVRGKCIPQVTTHVHLRDNNALEQQREKFAAAAEEWAGATETREPTPAMLADMETRIAAAARLRQEILGGNPPTASGP